MDGSNDVALYSGLGSGVVVVAVLVVAVMLYRRSQSNYGVDVIDSSALTGGFQSFTFKTTRQGELALPFTLCPVSHKAKQQAGVCQRSFRNAAAAGDRLHVLALRRHGALSCTSA